MDQTYCKRPFKGWCHIKNAVFDQCDLTQMIGQIEDCSLYNCTLPSNLQNIKFINVTLNSDSMPSTKKHPPIRSIHLKSGMNANTTQTKSDLPRISKKRQSNHDDDDQRKRMGSTKTMHSDRTVTHHIGVKSVEGSISNGF